MLPATDGLEARPFPAGGSMDIERAAREIGTFAAMVGCLPFGPGAVVMDLGAGPCWVSEWLQRLRYRTLSIDISEDMLRIGRRRLAPGSWLCVADLAALPVRDGAADAAVCYGALHHVPDWRGALREIHRALRPGGVLVLQEPGRGHHREAESIQQMEQFGVVEQELPPGRLARACREAGFTRALVRPLIGDALDPVRLLPPYRLWREAPRLFARLALRRFKAAAIESLMNALSPQHLVVASKGTVWSDSRRPAMMVAAIRRVAAPTATPAGAVARAAVLAVNTGLTRWLARTDEARIGQVRLAVTLLDAAGRILSLDFARADLPRDVAPGETVELAIDLPPVGQPGEYRLRFDLVAEGVYWFSTRGSRPREVPWKIR